MAEAAQQEPSPPPPVSGRSGRIALFAALAGLAIAGVLYGMMLPGGKESADNSACAASTPVADAIRPLAKGEVASLKIAKTPRPATPIVFDAPGGKRVTLADFSGKTILVNLWATWCAPCRAEMPALDRLQAKLGSEAFEVVAISIDTARLDRRQSFLESVGVKSLAFYADPKADIFQVLKQAGKVVGLPTTILIDGRGCELGVMAGPAEWDMPDAVRLMETAISSAKQ
ncbi:MAG: TlpA family protein disulfide reductase [Alphaproteobacteria bacterium]|nr:TlpA family protein disulfide reductase [Alphaproteobacteria bacterium]